VHSLSNPENTQTLRGWCVTAGLTALSGCHPEQNPALAGQNIYKSREVQDIQIARLIGKVGGRLHTACWCSWWSVFVDYVVSACVVWCQCLRRMRPSAGFFFE
jgi:hypothetical protein